MIRISRPEGHDWIGVALLATRLLLIAGTGWLTLIGVVEPVLAVGCVALEGLCTFMIGRELWGELVEK